MPTAKNDPTKSHGDTGMVTGQVTSTPTRQRLG